MPDLVCIDPVQVSAVWPTVSDLLATAYAKNIGDGTLEDVHGQLLAKKALLWTVRDNEELLAVLVTEILKTSKGRICQIVALAGFGMKRWTHLISDLEQYAKNEKCAALRVQGRLGWRHVLKDYREPFVTLERKL